MFSLKSKKNLHNKDSGHIKIDCRSKRQKKNIDEKKSQTTAMFLLKFFLYRKVHILLENTFWETFFISLQLYCSFLKLFEVQ